MSALYVETSAALAAINEAGSVLTSALTGLEVRRSLIRANAGGMLHEAAALHLMGRFETASGAWIVMELTSEVLARASMRFPVEPIRSLDAIHLATALEFVRAVHDMQVLSFDSRVGVNIEPLGMTRATASGPHPAR